MLLRGTVVRGADFEWPSPGLCPGGFHGCEV